MGDNGGHEIAIPIPTPHRTRTNYSPNIIFNFHQSQVCWFFGSILTFPFHHPREANTYFTWAKEISFSQLFMTFRKEVSQRIRFHLVRFLFFWLISYNSLPPSLTLPSTTLKRTVTISSHPRVLMSFVPHNGFVDVFHFASSSCFCSGSNWGIALFSYFQFIKAIKQIAYVATKLQLLYKSGLF
ncbi:hypothetical protein CDAR_287681 [Caerostris darwini]|uniref:Uncharacterized protein n=1 Tax=Caerostris darwini TaxID=1538125 RepID=A0AAV4NCV0_9ARAC|nr:hypothetical protein CDAR_287681 [Caerostris darwini]